MDYIYCMVEIGIPVVATRIPAMRLKGTLKWSCRVLLLHRSEIYHIYTGQSQEQIFDIRFLENVISVLATQRHRNVTGQKQPLAIKPIMIGR